MINVELVGILLVPEYCNVDPSRRLSIKSEDFRGIYNQKGTSQLIIEH